MNELKGKCKTCLGCNLLDDFAFKGRNKCKNYTRANQNEHIAIIIIMLVEIVMFMMYLGYFYYKFNRLCGGLIWK